MTKKNWKTPELKRMVAGGAEANITGQRGEGVQEGGQRRS